MKTVIFFYYFMVHKNEYQDHALLRCHKTVIKTENHQEQKTILQGVNVYLLKSEKSVIV